VGLRAALQGWELRAVQRRPGEAHCAMATGLAVDVDVEQALDGAGVG
jgi:hypothetical protein